MNTTIATWKNRYPNWDRLSDEERRKAIILGLVSNYHTVTLSPENISAFVRALRDVSTEDLQRIADFWADNYSDFPKSPADLRIKLQQHNEAKVFDREQAERERIQAERIAKCPFCDPAGWRYIGEGVNRKARRCTHKKSVESQFHGATKGKTPGLQDTPMPLDFKELSRKAAKKREWK